MYINFEYLRAWCGLQACRRRFFTGKTTFPDFLTMPTLETVRVVRISMSMDLGTCLKRSTPKNHEFWRYSDLQISHGEPVGEQNDELKFGHLVFLFPHFLRANIMKTVKAQGRTPRSSHSLSYFPLRLRIRFSRGWSTRSLKPMLS